MTIVGMSEVTVLNALLNEVEARKVLFVTFSGTSNGLVR
jgi:hypothetical protein